MKYRKLRIAWSVTWGVVALLLSVLWLRSYWWRDYAYIRIAVSETELEYYDLSSVQGGVTILANNHGLSPMFSFIRSDWGTLPVEPLWKRHPGWSPRLSAIGFAILHEPTRWFVTVPFWFLVSTIGSLAALPWLRFRFSLRILLIATTIVAVLLGVIVWLSK